MRPMTAEESWQHIMDNWFMYHKTLKFYGYDYNAFIPDVDYIKQMFEREQLPGEYVEMCKQKFLDEVYDENKLRRLEPLFEKDVKQKFEKTVNECLVPLLSSWGATMPKKLEIRCTFGGGSGYWPKDDGTALMLFRMSRFPDDANKLLGIMFHEFVHLLIEKPIVQKYHVPQDLKERIVDLICYEFIKKPVQKSFEKSFANQYITPATIQGDLPGTVKKMMTEYTAMNKYNQDTMKR